MVCWYSNWSTHLAINLQRLLLLFFVLFCFLVQHELGNLYLKFIWKQLLSKTPFPKKRLRDRNPMCWIPPVGQGVYYTRIYFHLTFKITTNYRREIWGKEQLNNLHGLPGHRWQSWNPIQFCLTQELMFSPVHRSTLASLIEPFYYTFYPSKKIKGS